ncbi:TonB-dependent receptor [Polymorphobacter multimanifer]|uniref:TonB-dependent receptor n=1 Tax=Polymorphobacter multimanifer TaxID=1070431 RepID=UPI0019A122DF|nr:TonB-dependent receptor [Polymorphobacter multimanifer]GGI76306.1 TonB-dependent receptor [Polymorphobacter multimanifer]
MKVLYNLEIKATAIAAALLMGVGPAMAQTSPASALPSPSVPPAPPAGRESGRTGENAVTQAEDAFGFSVGRESLGLYSAGNVRGFSPFAAGNVRIEGLYFDPFLPLILRLRQSTSIRVGLSAQGYPFPSPTGIVDYAFRKPGDEASLSTLVSADSYGNVGLEADAVVPIAPGLSLGLGAQGSRSDFYNGTTSWSHNQGISLRWRPTDAIEILPFWARSQVYDDEAGPTYIPAGPYLPPKVQRRRFDGPRWSDYDSVAGLQGLLLSIAPASNWLVRAGLFRSLYDDRSTFANLLTDVTPEGAANRLIIADPRSRFVSVSGELRVTRSVTEGPRLHVIHLSARGRDRRQRYSGSAFIDYGATRLGERFEPAEPDFDFTDQTRDRVRQWTGGVAYEGRWRGVGELSFGVSKTNYTKRFELPGAAALETRSRPWLYNVTAAGFLGPRLTVYADYARGLEESGVAPDNAANRNQPLPAILTSQVDAGFRYSLTNKVKLIAGVFDLRKPYYNLDADNRFYLLGNIVSRGVEMSVAGAITPRLNVVAGGVLLRPRVTGEGVGLGRVGERPVGLAARSFDFNADWRPPILDGLSVDIGVSHTGSIIATRNNLVSIPSRTLVDLGARYRFKLSGKDATIRAQVNNVGNVYGFDLRGAGAYDIIAGRVASAYLTVDF